MIENAKKCKTEEKSTVKDCYEAIYGPIGEGSKPAASGAGEDQGGVCKGKCVVF